MGTFDKNDYKKMASIGAVLAIIIAAFKLKFKPQPPVPPQLLYTGASMRQGLSASQTASYIISRQREAGAPVGVLDDGSENIAEKMEKIRVEEIFNALITQAKIDVVIPPGIPVTAAGGGIGTVVVQGATTNFASGQGVLY